MRAELFFTNPRLTALALLFIVVMGTMAYLSLARQEDPTMTERWARVNTFLPGATAERMESLISEPIETALREIPEVDEITSTSKAGLSVVGVQLYDNIGADQVDNIWSEIRDALGDVAPSLPAGASEPELFLNKPLASTLIVELSWTLSDSAADMNLLSRIAEELRLRLANLSGTETAETWGNVDEELVVAVDPHRLAQAGMTPSMVAGSIAAADTKSPAGELRSLSSDLLVEVDAELDSPARISNIPLRQTSNGSMLRVGDVASVTKQFLDPPNTMALRQGQRVVFVNAKMQPGLQIAAWTEGALARIESFQQSLPQGVELAVVYNQNVYTGARMRELGNNLAMALVIVLVTLIWFMGVRSALTVGIALPLSAAMVLMGMQLLGVPLHQMSVTGLIISLGLLIDNAIVVVEDYKLRRASGAHIAPAIQRAVKHLLIPLGASTATTVFAFMPIAMSPGGVGDFTGTLGVTVALSVASSFFLAMTVVPAIAGFLEQRWPQTTQTGRWWQQGFRSERLTQAYRGLLQRVLARPALGICMACVLPLIGFALAPTLTQQFFPPVDRNQFQVQLSLSPQASIADTQQAVAIAEQTLRAHPDVVDSFWTIGEGAPRVFYNVVSLNERVASFASGWVNTTSASATREILPELQRRLAAALPQAEVLALPFEQGPPRDAPIEMRIVGPDLDVLREQALRLREILSSVDNVIYTRAALTTAAPKLTFIPDEHRAAAVGLTTGDITQHLNDALAGRMAGTVQEGSTTLNVRVRIDDEHRDDMTDLSSLPLLSATGASVPLDQLGTWDVVPVASAINRQDGQRISTVQGYLMPFVLPASALAEFRTRLQAEGFALPAGYSLQLGGEAEQSSESMGNLVSMFVFFALAMALVVSLSLNSFRQSALIGVVAILSFGLALFGVRLFGHPFGYMALIGALGMMGLVINGAIIVLSALKANAAAVSGDQAAMADVVVNATRHIVSTTATTIGGFVPLIIAGGTFWPPLATAIAGGVGGSAIIALLMVPAVFSILHRPVKAATEVRETPVLLELDPPVAA